MDLNTRSASIISILENQGWASRSEITTQYNQHHIKETVSFMTISRELSVLLQLHFIQKRGEGKATKYKLSPIYEILKPIEPFDYFKEDINQRKIRNQFNFDIFDQLKSNLLTAQEVAELDNLDIQFHQNYEKFSETIKHKELERATIELSWKSSALEGNTYTLLETESLIKEGIQAQGKKQEETIMILNHKKALEYIVANREEYEAINVLKIEQLHAMLMNNLGIAKNIRQTLVGITGTRYKPLDNSYQIREALEEYCLLINHKKNVFEKAMITLFLISYIQPFEDGNKRTGRILANALLLGQKTFPISLRSLDINAYKEAMVIFYEQNNISLFKKIFIEQCEFAVANYFRASL